MANIIIDQGSYSIKVILYEKDRKKIRLISKEEIIISEFQKEQSDELSTPEAQKTIIKDILSRYSEHVDKVYYQLPHTYTTIREITLPVTQKKKVDLMTPFQLDETLPYPVSSCHYCTHQIKKNKLTHVLVSICSNEDFYEYHQSLLRKDILPSALYSEVSLYQTYAQLLPPRKAFGIIDFGHRTTKIYFFMDQRLVSYHKVYLAGEKITQALSKTYEIDEEDANTFKHENGFVLTQDQLNSVDETQRAFAEIMDATLSPLIQDIKRFELGFRSKYGASIENYYLTGGSANIANIYGYMTEQLVKQVYPFDIGHQIQVAGLFHSMTKEEKKSFGFTGVMAMAASSKFLPSNFLSGPYALKSSASLPLFSVTFIGLRVFIISLILIFTLGIQRIFLEKDNSTLRKSLVRLLKTPALGISKKDQRVFKKKPLTTYNIIRKKNNAIKQSIKSFSKSYQVNALAPLAELSGAVKNNINVFLEQYSYTGDQIHAVFKGTNEKELKALENQLKKSSFKNLITNIAPTKTELSVKFSWKN